VTAKKDDAPAAVQAAIVNVAGLNLSSAGGGLIQTTSGWRQERIARDQRSGLSWRACSYTTARCRQISTASPL